MDGHEVKVEAECVDEEVIVEQFPKTETVQENQLPKYESEETGQDNQRNEDPETIFENQFFQNEVPKNDPQIQFNQNEPPKKVPKNQFPKTKSRKNVLKKQLAKKFGCKCCKKGFSTSDRAKIHVEVLHMKMYQVTFSFYLHKIKKKKETIENMLGYATEFRGNLKLLYAFTNHKPIC